MLTRVCSAAKRVGGPSAAPRTASKNTVAPRRSNKMYCTGTSANDTLADNVAKNNGTIASIPMGETDVNVPTEHARSLADAIMNSTFIEVAQMTRLLQKRLGTSGMMMAAPMMSGGAQAAAPAAPVAAAPAPEAAKPAEPAKPARVDLKLVSFPDANKFKVLKEMRNLKPGMNLMESKALIEGLPKVVQEGLLYKEAEDWKKALNEAGAEVEFA